MKHLHATFDLGRPAVCALAAIMALTLPAASFAGATDISTTPIITSAAALVKPNVMLLMDASGSMGRTHMPDEVETITGVRSIGYKSVQCNSLYYNPAVKYVLPRDFNNDPFLPVTFNAAPYAGFGAYYSPTDTSTRDLRSQFVAYENATLDNPTPYLDPAQAAYYYKYTGPEVVNYASAPCTQLDIRATVATPGGGTWTRYDVSTLSVPEQTNFAIWYSFYRTRLSLTKSAASFAFAPINDTRRVGFITVEPKDTPLSGSINPIRYLPVGDFDPAQKNLWFNKVFSQVPHGASPAREGLARVGRYYSGQDDGINSGMPAHGADDPEKFACQQNFTIMTTDGYWNGHTETPGGGGVKLDGTTLVDQQDGSPACAEGDLYCKRPIWDGGHDSTRIVTDKTNAYTDGVCSSSGRFRSTYQNQRQLSMLTRDSTVTQKETIQYKQSTRQDVATSVQTTKTVTQTLQTRQQYALEKTHFIEERYQHVKWQEQTTQVRQQFELKTTQQVAQTFQTRAVVTQTKKDEEQYTKSTSQFWVATTQYVSETDQFKQSKVQKLARQFLTVSYNWTLEHGVPLDGDCVPSPGNRPIECLEQEVSPTQPADPSICPVSPATVAVDPVTHVKTTCTDGPASFTLKAVTSCTPGTDPAAIGNSWTLSYCEKNIVSPAAPINGTCAGTTQGSSPDYYVYVCTRPPANNTAGPVSSCTVGPPVTDGVTFVTTTCSKPALTNTPAAASLPCSTSTDGATLVTTTCTKVVDFHDFAASCTYNDGLTPPYDKVTCTTNPISNTAVQAGTCVTGDSGDANHYNTTCPRAPAGPLAVAKAQGSCSPDPVGTFPDFYEQTCAYPPGANNETKFVTAADCGTLGITVGTSPDYITRDCRNPSGMNNQTGFSDPRTCIPDLGTGFPYLTVSCTPAQTMPPTIVDPTLECTTFGTFYGTGPDYTVTHCDKKPYSPPTPVAACVPINTGFPDYVITTCGPVINDFPIAFCVLGPLPDDGIDKVTCVKPPGPNNSGPTSVATCTQVTPPTGPEFVETLCTGPTVLSSDPVNPALCTNSLPGVAPVVTCTTVPFGMYATPTPVAAPCAGGMDPVTFVVTSCTNPTGPTNAPATNSGPCTEGPSAPDVNQVVTTCTKSDLFAYVATAACTDTPQAGTGPQIICHTTTTLAEAVNGCVKNAVAPLTPFTTTTDCHNDITSPMADYAGTCVTGPTGPVGESAACNLRGPIDNHVADAGCVDNTNGSGVKTVCSDEVVGIGHTYSVVTTKTVTTTPFSGGVPAGASTVVTTPGASSPVNGGQCYATAQTFPDRPPVDVPLCGAWPCTASVAGAPGSSNSLADVAQYYYKTDLRSDFDDKLKPVGNGDEDDSAKHQHMTTFVLALGVSGTLKFRPDYRSAATLVGDFAEIRAGTRDWPIWPDAAIDYTNPGNYNNPKSIDDYWHTAVNGRGRFFSANDPNTAAQGLRDALATAGNQVASGSADGTSTLQLSSTNNFLYSTKYESAKWQGDVQARFVDPSSGVPGAVVWKAAERLATKVQDDCDDRSIWVLRGAALGEFAWHTKKCSGPLDVTGLNGAEQALLGGANVALLSQFPYMTDGSGTPATATQQQNAQADGALVNFLRGQRGTEGFVSNDAKKLFRSRETSLGDIVDSQPVYVKEPFASYLDAGYSTFKSTNAGRTPMIYVGANDGMLHAFYATLDLTDPLHGQEAWAVIPSAVLPNMYKLADDDYNRGGHQFYVDGTPVVGDINVAGNWKTILVGGLNAGGKGYYALDVTAAGATPTPLWEFKQNPLVCPANELTARGNTADCNLGLSFGKPVITKLKNTWVVMFTSGYNNLNGAGNGFDGGGFLYVLDAYSGQVMYKIATEVAGLNVGSIGSPSGLAQINNYVDNVLLDNTTLRAYGGDLLGNIWRFDFPDLPAVGTATLLGRAKDASNNAQPITVKPELAEVDGKPFVIVGTGKFLGGSDVTDLQVQSVYGLRDPLIGPVPLYADPMRNVLRPMKINQTPNDPAHPLDFSTAVRTIVCTGSASECDRSQGWVLDLGEPGERVNVEMKLVLGALVFASNVPQDVPCDVGGHSWFNQVDFRFGAPIPGAAVTTQFLAASLNVGFNVVQLEATPGSNPTYSGIFRQGDAQNVNKPVTPPEPTSPGRRISWREIPQ